MKKIISTPNAPAAIGPYSQAIEIKGILFISGQLPINPVSGEIAGDNVEQQTRQVLANIAAILDQAGYLSGDVVKTTCYLTDLKDFSSMNEVYAEFFNNSPPARATVEVSCLPRGVKIEIEAVAVK